MTTTLNPLSQFRADRFGVNSKSMHDICDKLGIYYSGDASLEHGGLFYEKDNWQKYGYSSAVQVSVDDGSVFITVGSINKPKDIASALSCCGLSIDDKTGDVVCEHDGSVVAEKGSDNYDNVVIESLVAYWGVEQEYCQVCKIKNTFGEVGEEYFVDGSKRVKMSDLQGYVLSQYVLPNVR